MWLWAAEQGWAASLQHGCSPWSFGCAVPQRHPGVTEVGHRGDTARGHLGRAARSAGIPSLPHGICQSWRRQWERIPSLTREGELIPLAIMAASTWRHNQLLTIWHGLTQHRAGDASTKPQPGGS